MAATLPGGEVIHFTCPEVTVLAGVEVRGGVGEDAEDQLRVVNEAAKFYRLGTRMSALTVLGLVDTTLKDRGFCQLTVVEYPDSKCVLKLQCLKWTHFEVAVTEILYTVHSTVHPDQLHLLASAKHNSSCFLLTETKGPVVLLLQLSSSDGAQTLHELLGVLKELHPRATELTFRDQASDKSVVGPENQFVVGEPEEERKSGDYLDLTGNIDKFWMPGARPAVPTRTSTGHVDMSRNSDADLCPVLIEVDETNLIRKASKNSSKKGSIFRLPSLKQAKMTTPSDKVTTKNGKEEEERKGEVGHDILRRRQSNLSTSSAKERAEAVSNRLLEESEKYCLLEVCAGALPEKLEPLIENLQQFHDTLTTCRKRNSADYGDFLKCILDNAETVKSYVKCYDLASFFGKQSDLAVKLMLKLTTLKEYLMHKEEEPQHKQVKGLVLLVLEDTLKGMKERQILWEVDQDKVQLLDCGEILFQGDVLRITAKKPLALYVILMTYTLMVLKRVTNSFQYVTHVINDKISGVEPNIKNKEVTITIDTRGLDNKFVFKVVVAEKIGDLVWALQKIVDTNSRQFF